MTNDPQSKPPTLDYQPVNKSRKHLPRSMVVFLVGFAVGVLWPFAVKTLSMGDVGGGAFAFTVCPFDFVGQLVYTEGHLWWIAVSLAFFTNAISYGLLALLGYTMYRRLRR